MRVPASAVSGAATAETVANKASHRKLRRLQKPVNRAIDRSKWVIFLPAPDWATMAINDFVTVPGSTVHHCQFT
jgi:hypothetical protein